MSEIVDLIKHTSQRRPGVPGLAKAIILKKLLLISFACCLLVLCVPATAPAEDERNAMNTIGSASDLIQAYLEIESPSSQDLDNLLAEPVVRNYGATAVTLLMGRLIADEVKGSPVAFDPGKNVRLFNLLEVLVKTPSAPPADNPEEALAIKLRDKMFSADDLLASGLYLMVNTFATAQDQDSAMQYYDRFKALPRKPMLDLSRANATLSLVQFYCRLGDLSSATKIYGDFSELARSTGVKLRRGQAAVSLVEAFSEAGRISDAMLFYTELDKLPQDKYIEQNKITAGRALIDGYKKTGDLKAAGEWETRIKAEEERLRIVDEKDRAATKRLLELFETDTKD